MSLYRIPDSVRPLRCSLLVTAMDDTPSDPREQAVRSRRPAPVPSHLVAPSDAASTARAIKEAARERVQAYRDANDNGRLSARNYLRRLVSEYGVDEVQNWLTECRVDKP